MTDELKLEQRFKMHVRLQGGSIMAYDILHNGKTVGSYSVRTVIEDSGERRFVAGSNRIVWRLKKADSQ